MQKQNVVHTYSGVLFSPQREGNPDTCYNMDEPWECYAKWKKPDAKGQVLYDPTKYKVARIDKIHQARSWLVVTNGWQEKVMGSHLLFNWYSFCLWWWKSSGNESWWCLYSIADVLNATELYTLKKLKMVKFYIMYVYHSLKKLWLHILLKHFRPFTICVLTIPILYVQPEITSLSTSTAPASELLLKP